MAKGRQDFLISEQELSELEDYINTVWSFVPIPVAYISPLGTIVDVNRAFEELLGYLIGEIGGRSLFDFCGEEAKMGQVHKRTLSGERVANYEGCRIADSGGRDIPVSISTLLRTDAETGQPIGYFAAFIDIAERKQAEDALRKSEMEYRTLVERLREGVYQSDLEGNFIILNEAGAKIFGFDSPEQVVGKWKMADFYYDPEARTEIIEGIRRTGSWVGEVQVRRRDGTVIWLLVNNNATLDGQGNTVGYEGVFADITQRRQAEETLRESEERYRALAVIDGLTGLYNRRYFYEVLEIEMCRTQRYGRCFSLLMLDLDGFKEYNDCFGHVNGDSVLESFARTLKSSLRKADISFRYGGDEFAVILPATNAERVKKTVDRMRAKWLQTPKAKFAMLESPPGFSAGVAQFPDDAETADGLVFLADTALLHAKRKGGYRSMMVSDLRQLSPDFLHATTMGQVYALAATVDARDPFTHGHSKMVAAVSESIGKAIGLSKKQLANLRAAGLLHDIGKVNVPDSVLTKPGELAEHEWDMMRNHCAEGAKIVGDIRALARVGPMIRHHHEWYNGTGYPDGLREEKIPLGARILAIADAFVTMTTPRPYGEVMTWEQVVQELSRCSGTQFDPKLVEVLCRVIKGTTEQG